MTEDTLRRASSIFRGIADLRYLVQQWGSGVPDDIESCLSRYGVPEDLITDLRGKTLTHLAGELASLEGEFNKL